MAGDQIPRDSGRSIFSRLIPSSMPVSRTNRGSAWPRCLDRSSGRLEAGRDRNWHPFAKACASERIVWETNRWCILLIETHIDADFGSTTAVSVALACSRLGWFPAPHKGAFHQRLLQLTENPTIDQQVFRALTPDSRSSGSSVLIGGIMVPSLTQNGTQSPAHTACGSLMSGSLRAEAITIRHAVTPLLIQ
jgi:hypothetical protein